MRKFWVGLRALILHRRAERDLDDEIQFHLDMHVEQLVERGMSHAQARRTAHRAFGNRRRHKENAREERTFALVEECLRDIAFATRALRNRPGFAASTILVLAIGIGANTTIFSAVKAVLFHDPPYEQPDRLAFLWQTSSIAPGRFQIPAPDLTDYRARTDVFEGVAFAANATDAVLQYGDRGEHVRVGVVTSNLFDVLGVSAVVGRTFYPGEAEITAAALADTTFVAPPSVVLLGNAIWVGRFGSDSSVVGRTVSIGGQQLAVVGVLPDGFALRTPSDVAYAGNIDVWTPLRIDVQLFSRPRRRDQDSDNSGVVIARLAEGTSFEQAQSAMAAVGTAQRQRIPAYRESGIGIDVVPLEEDLVAEARPILLVLQGAVGLVLLIACINVATMLAARWSSRRQELAIRTALGAARGRLIRQLLSEALVIATIAGVLGIVLAAFATTALGRIGAVALPLGTSLTIDGPVLAFTVLVTVLAALIAGVMPSIVFSATRFTNALRERSSSGNLVQSRIGRFLVVSQLVLSVALLTGAGLLLKSFTELHRVDPGFNPEGLVIFNLNLAGGNLGGPASRADFIRDVENRVRRLPGVTAIGLTNGVPLSGTEWTQPYGLEDQSEAEWERNSADFRMITSEYFAAMGIQLMAGRVFTPEEDVVERERIAIVDRALAVKIDPSGDVLGRRIGFPLDGAPIVAEIVGIVASVRHTSLQTEGRETIYVPYRQEASRSVAMAVRTSRDVRSLAAILQGELMALDAGVPVFDVTLMQAHVDNALAPTRFVMALVAVFAMLSLVLAASGLYGLLAFAVHQRTRELGVRLALGATERQIVGLVVRGGMLLVFVGLAVGIPASMLTSRALTQLLYGVSPTDPLTLLAVGATLTAVAVLACFVPARRASQIDPMTALRVE